MADRPSTFRTLPGTASPSTTSSHRVSYTDAAFTIAAAVRLGQRRLSTDQLARLVESLDRLSGLGDATAPVVLDWLLQKQLILVEGC